MKPYSFCEEPLSEGTALGCDLSLFNRPRHLLLQNPAGWRTFQIRNEKKSRTDGVLHFHVADGIAQSPFHGPFGSLDFSDGLPGEVLYSFLEYVMRALSLSDTRRVVIKSPPVYSHREVLLHVFLLNLGFHISVAEVGSLLETGSFTSNAATWEKRKLRQARESGLRFKLLAVEDLEVVYRFIEMCRGERQQSLSMQWEELARVVEVFPEDFVLAGIYDQESLAAASISIRVRSHVLYNFYSGHRKSLDPLSPVVMLMEGLHEYCIENHIAVLDLGTSALGGVPNFPLLGFKERLGGRPSGKYTFEKILR